MKKVITNLSSLIGFVFLIGISFFLYKIIVQLVINFDKVNINILVTIIGGTITISSFFITRYLERKKNIEVEIRNKKIPIYEEFFEFYFKVVFSSKDEDSMSQKEMISFFRSFNQKAIIWFPDHILKSYVTWKKDLIYFSKNNNNEELMKLILRQEDFLNEFRKDIGHSDKLLLKENIF